MNKRMKTKTLFTAAVVIATVCILTNCGTGKASAAGAGDAYANAPMPKGNNMSTDALSSTIIDWSDRGIGEEENPVWLLKLRRNGDDPIKSELGIPENSIVKVTSAEGSNRNEMRVQADLLFAAQTAQELQQIVKVGADLFCV